MRHNDSMNDKTSAKDNMGVGLIMCESLLDKFEAPHFTFDVECIGPDEKNRAEYIDLLCEARKLRDAGRFMDSELLEKRAEKLLNSQWKEHVHNTVLTAGKTDIVDKYFKGSAYTAAWYMLLKGTGSIVVGDTLASHGGWSEVTPYSGNRPTISFGTTTAGSNTATTQVISINATATVAGAGIASVNTGTSGTLYSATDFSASRGVASGDTLNVTPTVSVS